MAEWFYYFIKHLLLPSLISCLIYELDQAGLVLESQKGYEMSALSRNNPSSVLVLGTWVLACRWPRQASTVFCLRWLEIERSWLLRGCWYQIDRYIQPYIRDCKES